MSVQLIDQNNSSKWNDGVAYLKEKYIVPVEKNVKRENENEDFLPNKKRKSGKNVNRPKFVKEDPGKRLCRSHWQLRPGEEPSPEKCPVGERCQFSHDVKLFLSNKPDDLGEKCHNFSTYGFCAYGLICRFGNGHIVNNGSVVDEDKFKDYQLNPPVINNLRKELQTALRKRKYIFKCEAPDSSSPDAVVFEDADGVEASSESVVRLPSSDTPVTDSSADSVAEGVVRSHPREKTKIDWRDKLYLAPLTTLGNLPFRRVCKRLGADVTCSEMAVASALLQGSASEWALVKRHSSEDLFGVQLCGSNSMVMSKCAELLENEVKTDFVDINMGCPIDLIFKQGAGSALMRREKKVSEIVAAMSRYLSCPITLKMRTGIYKDVRVAHDIMRKAKLWDVSLLTLHGRSKEQRYTKLADWEYIKSCVEAASPIPVFGNGDVLTYDDYARRKRESHVAGIMIARGALIKPWLFTEIKEQRQWDISSKERLEILREYTNYGLEHWGSDTEGIEKTRRFLLEWLSFLYRYIPVGILERPQGMNQRPPVYVGRDHLETLMASKNVKDWIKISEMLLGPVPENFAFLPKHQANSWG